MKFVWCFGVRSGDTVINVETRLDDDDDDGDEDGDGDVVVDVFVDLNLFWLKFCLVTEDDDDDDGILDEDFNIELFVDSLLNFDDDCRSHNEPSS